MNYGYVKVAAAVPRVKVADCKFNASEIEKEIIIADGKGVQIIAFPELCVTGYTCSDLFMQDILLKEAKEALLGEHAFELKLGKNDWVEYSFTLTDNIIKVINYEKMSKLYDFDII